jgi:hypothetical protein
MSDRRMITRMRPILQLVLAMVILTATLWVPVYAEDNAVYLVTYIEVMPNAVAPGAALLERYGDASRKEIGNLSFDVATPRRNLQTSCSRSSTANFFGLAVIQCQPETWVGGSRDVVTRDGTAFVCPGRVQTIGTPA